MAGMMPDVSISEIILGAMTALFGGGAGAAVAQRRGAPNDVDKRIARLEKKISQQDEHMHAIENTLASLSRVGETTDRMWRSLESIAAKLDRLAADVVRLHVETTIDRELRKQQQDQLEDTEP